VSFAKPPTVDDAVAWAEGEAAALEEKARRAPRSLNAGAWRGEARLLRLLTEEITRLRELSTAEAL
jgi:hypothetical protein